MDLKTRHSLPVSYGQIWVNDDSEPKAMYTDSDGVDYDIVELIREVKELRIKTALLQPTIRIDL